MLDTDSLNNSFEAFYESHWIGISLIEIPSWN